MAYTKLPNEQLADRPSAEDVVRKSTMLVL
jgi:hypothetical protein